MRREDEKYILGTAEEIAKEIVKNYCDSYNIEDFLECDFAIVDLIDPEDFTLEEIRYNSSGWYGIKRINTGFDSNDLDLFADYYGGSCGVYDVLYDGLTLIDCVAIVKNMIMSTLQVCESCKDDTVLIAEIL